MTEWTTTEWPDWTDAGRRVEVDLEDGRTVQGELFVADFFPDDQGDEVPMFQVRSDDGKAHEFAANKRWRFVVAPALPTTEDVPPMPHVPPARR